MFSGHLQVCVMVIMRSFHVSIWHLIGAVKSAHWATGFNKAWVLPMECSTLLGCVSLFIFNGKLFHIAFHILEVCFHFKILVVIQCKMLCSLFCLPGLYVINDPFTSDNCMFFCDLFREQHNDLSLMSSVNFQCKIYV